MTPCIAVIRNCTTICAPEFEKERSIGNGLREDRAGQISTAVRSGATTAKAERRLVFDRLGPSAAQEHSRRGHLIDWGGSSTTRSRSAERAARRMPVGAVRQVDAPASAPDAKRLRTRIEDTVAPGSSVYGNSRSQLVGRTVQRLAIAHTRRLSQTGSRELLGRSGSARSHRDTIDFTRR